MTRFGYSIDFFADCFPSLFEYILPDSVVAFAFPASTKETCPTPTIVLASHPFPPQLVASEELVISWPNLFFPCLLGVLIGFGGSLVVSHKCFPRSPDGKTPVSSRDLLFASKAKDMFSRSLFYFGIMNSTAAVTHCVFPVKSFNWELAYCGDMVATSTSSYYLILASLYDAGKPDPFPLWLTRNYFILAFLVQWAEIKLGGRYFVAEFLYIGVTVIAAVVAMRRLVMRKARDLDSQFGYLLLAVLGAGLFAASPALDSFLCQRYGPPNGNMLMPAFLGCDLAFVGILLYSISRIGQVQKPAKRD